MFNPSLPRSADNHPDERLKDRKKRDWPDAMQADGVLNRILFAAPGQVLKFRPGTDKLNCNHIIAITFAEIMEVLCRINVVRKNEDGSYTKVKEDCGSNLNAECLKEPDDGHPLVSVAQYHMDLVEDSIDITVEANLRAFIQKRVDKIIEDRELKIDNETRAFLRTASADVTGLMTGFVLGKFPISSINDRVPMSKKLIPQIQRLLEFKETGFEVGGGIKAAVRDFLGGGRGKYATFASNVAFDIMCDICRHPANKDPLTQMHREDRKRSVGVEI